MQYTGLLTLGASVILIVIATRIARAGMQREYSGFRQTRDSLSEANGASPGVQGRLTKKDMTFLAIILVTVLFLFIMSRHIWYMPLSVPTHVRDAAYDEKPTGLIVTDERQGVSPLHYRVELFGRRNDSPNHVFTYSVNRITGSSNTVLTVSDGRERDLRFIWLIFVCVVGALAYTAFPYLLGKPCPNCGSKPFRLINESQLSLSQIDADGNTRPMVCEGHYACESCGYNRIRIYEGSRLNHGERAQSSLPLEHDDRAFLYRDDIGPGREPAEFDEKQWQQYYRQLKEERERDWMDGP